MLSDKPLTPGRQRAGAAHDQVDLDTRLRGVVQRIDRGLVGQCVHLRDHARWLAAPGELHLVGQRAQQIPVQRERRHPQML